MAVPILSITPTPVNATDYMLRYELNVQLAGTAGVSNFVTIANDDITASPNMRKDSGQGTAIRKAVDILGIASIPAGIAAMMENENLRITLTSFDPAIQLAVVGDYNPGDPAGRPTLTLQASTALATTVAAAVKGVLTIEMRHSIAQ